jgi:hypothetical protein
VKTRISGWWLPIPLLAAFCAPANATVNITVLGPTLKSPQSIGATVGWVAEATDTNAGPVTFQFNVAAPGGTLTTIKNFNVGTVSGSTWKSILFSWALTGINGTYQIQAIAKDFTSGETSSKTVSFVVTTPVTGANPVIQNTQNPLVALFTAPACPAGSTMAVTFQPPSLPSVPAVTTNWADCQPDATISFEIAGMYPSTAYNMFAQVNTGGNVVNGPTVSYTTGALPSNIPLPTFQVRVQDSDGDPNWVIMNGVYDVVEKVPYAAAAADLSGNLIWYNYPNDKNHSSMMTRTFPNGFVAVETGPSWIPNVLDYQTLRQFDWEGNIIKETNTGILARQVLALGDPNAKLCDKIPTPPPVGAACIGIFSHEAIETLPNGYTAAILNIEKIFPAGTQGDTSNLPVDIVGDLIVVLDRNWNAVWYWDAFDPLGGGNGYPLLPITRTAVLNEQCGKGNSGCLSVFLLRQGIAPKAHDWVHGNSIYYWPHDGAAAPSTAPGDLIWSSRHQDWVAKIDYQDGAGTGDILWRMGPSGDFSLVNTYNDPWPWFSHQHDAGIQNNGTNPLTVMDNGNTRVSPPGASTGGIPGLGSSCGPNDCNSRGVALMFDETTMQVNPVLSVNLGVYSTAMGSAQLLADGNYYFMAAVVATSNGDSAYDIEIQPTAGTDTGIQLMNISGPPCYRGWQMPSLYSPPII